MWSSADISFTSVGSIGASVQQRVGVGPDAGAVARRC